MKQAKVLEPGRMVIEQVETPSPGPDDVLIRVAACGICGTDIHIFRGEYLGSYPVVPGHEFSGVVEAVGENVTRFAPGDRVAIEPNISCNDCGPCLHNRQNFCENWAGVGVTRPGGMAQYAVVPEPAVFSIGSLSFEEGAFMEPLSCVLHGVGRAGVAPGSKVLVVGAGPIGILLMKTARAFGAAEITVAERNIQRLAFAEACGANRLETRLEALAADSFDLVIDATGVPPVMAQAIRFARPGGTILLFGVPPNGSKMEIEAFPVFRKGLTILSSYTSVRNSFQAVALMESERISVSEIVSHRIPVEDLQKGIEMIENGTDGVKKVLVVPNGAVV